jgi:nitronate monooxygenase
MGADLISIGTHFIATTESMAVEGYKDMVVASSVMDIVQSDGITGVAANWMRESLLAAGFDPNNMPDAREIDVASPLNDSKRWRDIWLAGQAVGGSRAVECIPDRVKTLEYQYKRSHNRT